MLATNPPSNLKNRPATRLSKKSGGFTLVELLIALSIIAVGLTAVLQATLHATRNASALNERSIAHWVAVDVLINTQINHFAGRRIQNNGERRINNRLMYWRLETKETNDKHLIEVSINVADSEDNTPITNLIGFLPLRVDKTEW